MKIVIVDSYYPRFLSSVFPQILEGAPDYRTLKQRLLNLRFGTADFYSRNLMVLGHQADDLIFNCEPLQRLWAEEHDNGKLKISGLKRLWDKAIGRFHRQSSAAEESLLQIAVRQIRSQRPDILYIQDLNLFPPSILTELRREGAFRVAVGQIACPLPSWDQLKGLDLILTSFPHYVTRFRERGIASEYFRIGFDPIVLSEIPSLERDLPCTFVGGISPAHAGRLNFLERLAENTDITFFGYGADNIDAKSPIAQRHQGEAWALDMYSMLARSKITINVHIDVAENYANNMRLYEATGCGALLITDQKDNLAKLFEPEREIITYGNVNEAVDKIRYYTSHDKEAREIAEAGQRRTLREHTYANRMEELLDILPRYL